MAIDDELDLVCCIECQKPINIKDGIYKIILSYPNLQLRCPHCKEYIFWLSLNPVDEEEESESELPE